MQFYLAGGILRRATDAVKKKKEREGKEEKTVGDGNNEFSAESSQMTLRATHSIFAPALRNIIT